MDLVGKIHEKKHIVEIYIQKVSIYIYISDKRCILVLYVYSWHIHTCMKIGRRLIVQNELHNLDTLLKNKYQPYQQSDSLLGHQNPP